MTHEEIEQAAKEGRVVVYKARNSTEIVEYRGRITETGNVYKGGKTYPVVVVQDMRANSVTRVAPEDILRLAEVERSTSREKKAAPVEYVVLGHIAASNEYRVMAWRGGAKAALYSGRVREERGVMDLYIKEPYQGGMPGKDSISLSLLRNGGA